MASVDESFLGRRQCIMTATDATQWLDEISQGDRRHADRLITCVYDELKIIAARQLAHETPGNILQPTALVHEAFLRLVDQERVSWRGKTHFLAISAQMMRRVLVDHARAKLRQKRGGGCQRIALRDDLTVSNRKDEDVVAVDDALIKLAELDADQAQIVELRFFGGMTVDEVAEVLNKSKRSVERQWTAIRAWLRRELAGEDRA